MKDRKRGRQKGEKAVNRQGEILERGKEKQAADRRRRVGGLDSSRQIMLPGCGRTHKHMHKHTHSQTHKGHSALAALQTHSGRDIDTLINLPRQTQL